MRTKREKHPWIADVDDPRYHYGREDFADMESRAGDSFAMLMLVVIFATLALAVAVVY
jgi:hypothetical protein